MAPQIIRSSLVLTIRPAILATYDIVGTGKRGVEIGVKSGANALAMALALKPKKLYAVDPWDNYVEPVSSEIIGEWHYLQTLKKLQRVKDAVEIVRMRSEDAVKKFRNSGLDFIYIDGQHTFEAVSKDLTMWWPKIRKGGVISGHDVSLPQVQAAVVQFTTKRKIEFTVQQEDWWFVK